jgi:stringent starvation protein B
MTRKDLEEMLQRPGRTQVVVNPAEPGVRLPEHLMRERVTMLNLSMRYGPDLPMSLDYDGIRARLAFGDLGAFDCFLPWASVLGVRAEGSLAPGVWNAYDFKEGVKRGHLTVHAGGRK